MFLGDGKVGGGVSPSVTALMGKGAGGTNGPFPWVNVDVHFSFIKYAEEEQEH